MIRTESTAPLLRRKEGHVIAVLVVQPPCSNFWFRDEHASATFSEVQQLPFLLVVAVLTAHLYRIRDHRFESVAFVIEVAPHKRRLAGVVHKRRNFFAAFDNRPASFLSLLIKPDRWQREKKPVGCCLNVNHMLNLC